MRPGQAGVVAPDQPAVPCGRPGVTRWPRPEPDKRYIAMLGGSSTLGKSVSAPFPTLVAAATGVPVVNLGTLNAGPDVYLSDPEVLDLIARADMAVVQLGGAETLSNPYYTVHSRRNDRFLAAQPALRALFPEVDLTEIHFARHLLHVLSATDAERFKLVVRALKTTWVSRMQSLLAQLPPCRRLLWLSDSPPPLRADSLDPGPGPMLVDADMLARLRPLAGEVMVVVPSPAARQLDEAERGTLPGEGCFPTGLPGQAAHREVAAALVPEIAAQGCSVRRAPLMLRERSAIP